VRPLDLPDAGAGRPDGGVEGRLASMLRATGRYEPDACDLMARWAGSFYETMASRSGVSAEELYARFPLRVGAGDAEASRPESRSAFEKWFGSSKVVDSDGRPLVVYHGGQRLTAWNRKGDGRQIYGGHAQAVKDAYGSMLSPLERQALDKPVHFFTDDLSVAEGYADQGEHYEVRSEFLRMERPLDLRADVVGDEVVEQHLRRILGPDFEMPSPGYGQERAISQALRWNWSRVREAVEQMGYDGIVLYDTDVRDRGLHTSYAVFEPSRIKSADANDGSFDLDDPDRLSQQASAREPRGTFDPRTLEIALGPKADASTWIHETGHFFLEVLTHLAAQPDAPQDIVRDANQVLDWLGVHGTGDLEEADDAPAASSLLDQTAFHGSPHEGIERFSTDKIGSGEGAAAYGWGLYFASRREVAEWYRQHLSASKLIEGIDAKRYGGSQAGVEEDAIRLLALSRSDRWAFEMYLDEGQSYLGKIARDIKSGRIRARQGRLYVVDIPDDDELLDWDRPLSEQPQKVREALEGLKLSAPEVTDGPILAGGGTLRIEEDADFGPRHFLAFEDGARYRLTRSDVQRLIGDRCEGKSLYQALATAKGSDRAASETLAGLGIKGIKYLDGYSRDSRGDSFNYVIFRGEDVRLLDTAERTATPAQSQACEIERPGAAPSAIENDLLAPLGCSRTVGEESLLGDYGDVKAFEAAYKSSTYRSIRFVRYDAEGNPIGALQFRTKGARSKKGVIQNIYTAKSARRTGVASGLLRFAQREFDIRHSKDLTDDGRAFKAADGKFYQVDGAGSRPAGVQALPRRRTALQTWHAMSLEQKRHFHEKWAEAVEQYVMEGNAPNDELEPLFKTFARWLCSLYTSVKQFLAMRSGRSADVAATVPGAQDAPGGAPASPQRLEQQTPRAPPPCPTEAPAFRSWFGNSKVVDGEGRPLVLHHGSPAEFNAFDPRRAKDGSFGRGFYFTNCIHGAASYGPARDFYLSMQNPASMQDGLSVAFDTERLKRRGFDGILIQMKASGETIAVAFSPEQIKSASSNDGTFDRDDPSILSQGPTATHAAMAAPADPLTDEIRGVMDRLLARMDDLDADQDGESSRPRMRSA